MIGTIRAGLLALSLCSFAVWILPAQAAPNRCTSSSNGLGMGIFLTSRCTAAPRATGSPLYSEAYYSIRATATTGPAFADIGKRSKSSLGKVLSRMAEKLLGGDSAGKGLTIGWQATIGGQTYPVQPLITIAKGPGETWKVTSLDASETLMHRMDSSAKVTLVYFYSDRATIDLSNLRNMFGLAVPRLASPAVKPVFDLVQSISQQVVDASSAKFDDAATQTLNPAEDDAVLVRLNIRDPFSKSDDEPQDIAIVTFELRGTRSLLQEEVSFDKLDSTMPGNGDGAGEKLNRLTRYATSGKPADWPAVYSALAGMGSNAPVGTTVESADKLAKFCSDAAYAIDINYKLTGVDTLLLQAAIVNLATSPLQSKMNPFTTCFPDPKTRQYLSDKLALTSILAKPQVSDMPVSNGLTFDPLLKTAAAWFTSRSCSDADVAASPFADYLADSVEITAREDLKEGNKLRQLDIPDDLKVTREALLKASCGSFPWWNTRDAAKGQIQFDDRESSGGWRLTGRMTADRKITSLRISPVRP